MSISGKYLSALVNGVSVQGLFQWEADDSESDKLDRTNGGSEGYLDWDIGCLGLRITLHLNFDTTTGVAVPSLTVGNVVTDINLYRNASDNTPAFSIPNALVASSPETVEVRGKAMLTPTLLSKGPFTHNVF